MANAGISPSRFGVLQGSCAYAFYALPCVLEALPCSHRILRFFATENHNNMNTQPIDFKPPSEEAPTILLPLDGSLFADRASRFERLAEGHSLSEWLQFLAQVSRAQHAALGDLGALPVPDSAAQSRAAQHGMPLLDYTQRPAAWREVLLRLAADLRLAAPAATREILDALLVASDEHLEFLADGLLTGEPGPDELPALPFVAAALQVVFTRMATQLEAHALTTMDAHNVCPCCGSPAVASVVRLGSVINNLRYLHCSLCNTEWNVPRAVCTHCAGDSALGLHTLEDMQGPMRAETCEGCKSYLKIVYQEKDPQADPVADDLATLALDMLLDEAGYQRSGPNLLLLGAYSG